MVDAVVKEFGISLEGMQEVSQMLLKALEKGLEDEENAVVKMFITYVHSLPDGTEEGDFLALDLGGSNFRVLLLSLERGGVVKESKVEKTKISLEKKQGTQEVLFDFIAQSMADFTKKYDITRKLPLGFTFSFPVKQTSLTAGTLRRWTKDFKASGAEGRDVIEMLHEALARRKEKDVTVDVVALLNDTTGTQLAVGYEDRNCHVGLILGTGTNACYMEKTAAIPKYTGDRTKHPEVIINCEWGAFGDDGVLSKWKTPYDDDDVEKKVDNPGEQMYEKLISGKYLGAITHAALLKLVGDGILFGGTCSATFKELVIDRFNSAFLSIIEGKNGLAECQKLFKEKFQMEVSMDDCEVVRKVCEAVSTRAARLAAAGVVTLVKKIGKIDSCTVAVDGSLYKEHPSFSERMHAAMNELAPGNGIVMKLSTDGSGKGAAVVAAVACRLRSNE